MFPKKQFQKLFAQTNDRPQKLKGCVTRAVNLKVDKITIVRLSRALGSFGTLKVMCTVEQLITQNSRFHYYTPNYILASKT